MMQADLAIRTAGFSCIPTAQATRDLAAQLRQKYVRPNDGCGALLERICEAAGVDTAVRELSGRSGGQEGLLYPRPDGTFLVAIDPTPCGGWDRGRGRYQVGLARHRTHFRVAHELGHIYFYDRRARRARRRLLGSAAQERFCDLFARQLLVPADEAKAARTTRDIIELQRRCDVSLEVVTRAVAAARPATRVELFYGPSDRLTPQWSSLGRRPGRLALEQVTRRLPRDAWSWLPGRQQLLVAT